MKKRDARVYEGEEIKGPIDAMAAVWLAILEHKTRCERVECRMYLALPEGEKGREDANGQP